jgi:hypothetical protein
MKLFVDPFIDADLHHAINIARTRTERQPIESVDGTLTLLESIDGWLLLGRCQQAGKAQNEEKKTRQSEALISAELHSGPPRKWLLELSP